MSKYGSNRPPTPKVNREVHPVMRGIGCIMMIIVPIISFIAATVIVNTVPLPLPPGMTRAIDIPAWLYALNGLQSVFQYIESQPLFIAILTITLIITILLFATMSIVYGFIYKAFGPSQFGPTDEPPIRKKVKKYTR